MRDSPPVVPGDVCNLTGIQECTLNLSNVMMELLSLTHGNHLVECYNSTLYFPLLGSINEKLPQREGAGKAGNYLEMNLHNGI